MLQQNWDNSIVKSKQHIINFPSQLKTHNGLEFNALKTNLREGIRYQNIYMVKKIIEDIFMLIKYDYSNTMIKGMVTNILNKLKDICVEDVSLKSVTHLAKISRYISIYENIENKNNIIINSYYYLWKVCIELLNNALNNTVCSQKLRLVTYHKRYKIFQNIIKFYISKLNEEELLIFISNMCFTQLVSDRDERRQLCAFAIKKLYILQLGLCCDKDLMNVQTYQIIKKNKMERFKKFWELLIASTVTMENKNLESYLLLNKEIFEDRVFFPNESLCLLLAFEAVFATVRGLQHHYEIIDNFID